jgi:hypothetical protein
MYRPDEKETCPLVKEANSRPQTLKALNTPKCNHISENCDFHITCKIDLFRISGLSQNSIVCTTVGHLCALVVRFRGPGFYSRRYQILLKFSGFERGPLSLVMIIKELI